MKKSPLHIDRFVAQHGIQPKTTRSRPDFVKYPLQGVPWELISLPDCRIAQQSRACIGVHIKLVEITCSTTVCIPYSASTPCCCLFVFFEGRLQLYGEGSLPQTIIERPNGMRMGYHPAGEYMILFSEGSHRFMFISIDKDLPCNLALHFPAFGDLLSSWLNASAAALLLPYIPLSKTVGNLLDKLRFSQFRKIKDAIGLLSTFEQCVNWYHKQMALLQQADNDSLAAAGQSLQDYLLRNYNDDLALRISFICQQFGWSKHQLNRIVSLQLKKGIRAYIEETRFARACKLLKKSKLTVVAISLEIGYTDPDYFSKLFKRKKGLSPTDYRNKET